MSNPAFADDLQQNIHQSLTINHPRLNIQSVCQTCRTSQLDTPTHSTRHGSDKQDANELCGAAANTFTFATTLCVDSDQVTGMQVFQSHVIHVLSNHALHCVTSQAQNHMIRF